MLYKAPGIYKGSGLYKGASIYNGAGVYNDGGLLIYYVDIGGRTYPAVKIGSQFWTAENLDWKFTGCIIGSSSMSTTDMLANYYDNDENTYGLNGNKYGLLYNYAAAMYINSNLPDGWRVPSTSDVATLKTFIEPEPGKKLKSKYGWFNGGNGTDKYGFCGVPAGMRQTNFLYINEAAVFWTSTELGTYDAEERGFAYNSNGIGGAWGTNKGFRFSVRLVKDA